MSERTHEQKVKDVSVEDDCLTIELLNGLRLSGPLRTSPIYRETVKVEPRSNGGGNLPAMSV